MITSSAFNEGILTIAINGHIDSSQVTMLQNEIDDAIDTHRNEINELILDAENMSFISSLGLRSILQLKKNWSNVQVVNCSADVYNAFKLTGFTRLITITKALPSINDDQLKPVEDLKDVFRLSEETMVKVFSTDASLEEVEHEVQQSREVFIWGVPTVMTFDIVKVKGSYGIIFESIMRKHIDAATLGELLRSFHQYIIEPDQQIPSAIEREKQTVKAMTTEYGEERVAKMLQALNTIPDASNLLHGNLSLRYIAYSQEGNRPIVVDMSNIAYGNPVIDLTHLYCSLPEDMQGEYFDAFLHSYYNEEEESSLKRIKQNITTLARAYRCFEDGIMDCWDEIFSDLHFKMDFAELMRGLERERFYLDSNVNIDWVANALGTNRHYVSDYFNKVLHISFSEYINNLRLEHAVNLLRSGRVPHSQVSYSSGFNNDHTFRRLFKQKYGCTPSQFK